MLGWIVWQAQGKPRWEICRVCDVPVYRLETPLPRYSWQRRRFFRQTEEMRRRGVRQVVVQGTGDDRLLWQAGLAAVEVAPLRLALLPQLLDYAQREWKLPLHTAAVHLRGKTADAAAYHAAQILIHRVRYLHLTMETGQAEMEEMLRRRYGLGVGGGNVEMEVCLGTEGGEIPGLYLGEGCGARQKLELFCAAQPQAGEQMLSALVQAEKLKADEIRIKSVGFRA